MSVSVLKNNKKIIGYRNELLKTFIKVLNFRTLNRKTVKIFSKSVNLELSENAKKKKCEKYSNTYFVLFLKCDSHFW